MKVKRNRGVQETKRKVQRTGKGRLVNHERRRIDEKGKVWGWKRRTASQGYVACTFY